MHWFNSKIENALKFANPLFTIILYIKQYCGSAWSKLWVLGPQINEFYSCAIEILLLFDSLDSKNKVKVIWEILWVKYLAFRFLLKGAENGQCAVFLGLIKFHETLKILFRFVLKRLDHLRQERILNLDLFQQLLLAWITELLFPMLAFQTKFLLKMSNLFSWWFRVTF